MSTFIPYRSLNDITYRNQISVASAIIEIVHSNLGQYGILLCLGFGSFWQNYTRLRDNSDIDFFVLLKAVPQVERIAKFGGDLRDAAAHMSLAYPFSPQIFVGSLRDVASGPENIVRCLTIHDKHIEPPVVLIGSRDIHLLSLIDSKKLIEWFRQSLFGITRHLYNYIANPSRINRLADDRQFLLTQQKFVQRFISAVLIAQDMFSDMPNIINDEDVEIYMSSDALSLDDIISALSLLHSKLQQ